MIISKIKLKSLLLTLLLLVLFFYEPIINWLPLIGNVDELIGIASVLSIPFVLGRVRSNKQTYFQVQVMLSTLAVLILLGTVSNYISGYNVSIVSKLIDALTLVKVPLAFLMFNYLIDDVTKKEVLYLLRIPVGLFLVGAAVFDIANILGTIDMSYDVRFGIPSFRFYFNNPGSLNERLFLTLIVASGFRSAFWRRGFVAVSAIIVLTTFRFNAVVTLALWPLVILVTKGKKKVSIGAFIPIGVMAAYLGRNQLASYFLNGGTPRQVLFKNGKDLMLKYFPFGTGFSTYGSDQAAKNYSALYYELGFSKIWGMQPLNQMFLHDSFWPILMAQYGFFGIMAYIILIVNMMQLMLRMKSINRALGTLIFLYLVISSVGASILLSVEGLTLVVFMTLLTSNDNKQER